MTGLSLDVLGPITVKLSASGNIVLVQACFVPSDNLPTPIHRSGPSLETAVHPPTTKGLILMSWGQRSAFAESSRGRPNTPHNIPSQVRVKYLARQEVHHHIDKRFERLRDRRRIAAATTRKRYKANIGWRYHRGGEGNRLLIVRWYAYKKEHEGLDTVL